MIDTRADHSYLQRGLATLGAVFAAGSVGLSAHASHAFDGSDQARLLTAAVFAFGHGVALAALAPTASGRLARTTLLALATGTLLFCGSLTTAVYLQWRTTLAPLGGQLLIIGWLLWAVHAWRR